MANKEHLDILKQGVEMWNRWREENLEVRPSLGKADLRSMDLSRANLCDAYMLDAHLFNANLSGADLLNANLSGAFLVSVNFNGAKLINANLGGADLTLATLVNADLSGALLLRANSGGANLLNADLTKTILREANLINAKLDCATITNACLWETQRAGWSIKGVNCDAVYWDREAKILTKFEPGEFERLHSEKPVIILNYAGGITAIEIATLPGMIANLASENPGCVLRLKSIQQGPSGATVEIAVDESGGTDMEVLKKESIKMQASQMEISRKMDGLVSQIGRTHTKLIEAMAENVRKVDAISGDIWQVKLRIEELLKAENVSQEKLDELAQEIGSLPSDGRNAILGLLTNLAAAPWAAIVLKMIEKVAGA